MEKVMINHAILDATIFSRKPEIRNSYINDKSLRIQGLKGLNPPIWRGTGFVKCAPHLSQPVEVSIADDGHIPTIAKGNSHRDFHQTLGTFKKSNVNTSSWEITSGKHTKSY
jgi:hypothetical protein